MEAVDVDGITKRELLEYAKENNVPGISAADNKADIIKKIKSNR